MCVSTIHQFKGSERHLVILLGIYSSFFGYFARDIPDDGCPNGGFVALTCLETACFGSRRGQHDNDLAKIAPPDAPGRPLKLGLTLPSCISVRDMLSPPLPKEKHINIPDVVCSNPGKGFHEAVSDINGLVIAAAFEHNIAGTLNTFNLGQSALDVIPPICSPQYVSWLCRNACAYEARLSGYLPRSIQMENHTFDWIAPGDVALARKRLQGELADLAANLRFEVKAEQTFSVSEQKTRLQGQADIVAEIKFVSQLSDSHVVQACAYAYLLGSTHIMLYNVRDGEKWEIIPHDVQVWLQCMIESVLGVKYMTAGKMDGEFIKMCARTMLGVLNLDGSSP
ncbi:hypothetical protein V8C42DRAFT_356297 [Trichoderma barbatum]